VPEVTVGLPVELTAPHPARDVICDAATVGQALRAVVTQAPQYEQRIFSGERLLVAVTLNGEHVPPRDVQGKELSAGDRVDIMSPVAGG
jgi:thiamine biosynthesis protein ThiS